MTVRDESEGQREIVYVTVYQNQFPDDGFEVGDVYYDEAAAEEAAARQADIKWGWENASVVERRLRLDAPKETDND